MLREALKGAERVHLIGLVSDGGVHSSLEHLRGAGRGRAASWRWRTSSMHAFTDGRDTLPHAGGGFLAELDAIAGARVGSVVGRYWAMDRDRRWDRTQRAYDLLVHGRAPYRADSGADAVREAYDARRDRRVHRAHGGRRGGPHPPAGLGAGVQLPPRPHAPADARAGRAGLRRGRARSCPAGRDAAAPRRWRATRR